MIAKLRLITQQFHQETNLDKALAQLVSGVKHAMAVESCSIFLLQDNCYTLKATDGLAVSAINQVKLAIDEGLVGWVGQREEPINLANAKQHRYFKSCPNVQEDHFNAFLGVPVIHQRKLLGVMTIQQIEPRIFNQEEESFLVTLSIQLASILVPAQVRDHLQREHPAIKANSHIQGISSTQGIAIAAGLVRHTDITLEQVVTKKVFSRVKETNRFYTAVKLTRHELSQLNRGITEQLPSELHAIFEVYQHLLDVESLGRDVERMITTGWCAASALKLVVKRYIGRFESMQDNYIRDRADDIRALGDRILYHLTRRHNKRQPALTDPIILIAEQVTAPMLAEIPRQLLKGIISISGSSYSHVSIMAKAMGIPMIIGIDHSIFHQLSDKQLIIDGYSGKVFISPEKTTLEHYQIILDQEADVQAILLEQRSLPAQTQDEIPIHLYMNAGLSGDAELQSIDYCDGIGLYRTESTFLLRHSFPSENELYQQYQQILAYCQDKPVTLRTLDIGGDKNLSYFTIKEDNPFLGWRGIRITLDHPEIFLMQIRAMLKANRDHGNLHILLPMITCPSEVAEALRLIGQALTEIQQELAPIIIKRPKIGIMIEVPAIIEQLPHLIDEIDFCSVGTNDLTQYLLAVDRNNHRVASLYDSLHPSVLKALQRIINITQQLQLPTSLCGELSGNPAGVLLLLAFGYRHLSMNINEIPMIKWLIRRVTLAQCQTLAEQCLAAKTPYIVKDLINNFMQKHDLSLFVQNKSL